MTRIPYAEIELDVPEGWRDASTITLVGPMRAPALLPHPRQPDPALPPTFLLRRDPLPDAPDAFRARVEEQLSLARAVPGAKVLERRRENLHLVDGEVEAEIFELELEGPAGSLRQWQLYFERGGLVHALVGTASVGPDLEENRRVFWSIARSLRYAKPTQA